MRIIKNAVPMRLHSGSGLLIFVLIAPCFAISKNVVHCLEPGETPSYSASRLALNDVQRSKISLNVLKRFGAVAVRLRLCFQFALVQY